jgi:haloalkane dehalogenase
MKKSFVKIGDDKVAFVDEGEGFPVLFIHGFPTSSFLWKDASQNSMPAIGV